MTNKQAIELLKWFGEYNDIDYHGGDMIENDKGDRFYRVVEEDLEAFDMAIKALEQELREDTISRQEVQDLLATWLSDYLTDETREVLETIDGKVGDMPSVTPKQRTGHWINHINELFPVESEIECSECGHKQTLMIDDNFCPQCGAKMEG